MALGHATISEIALAVDGPRLRLEGLPENLRPAPGQYLAGYHPNSQEILAVPLFPAYNLDGDFFPAASLPVTWQAGSVLDLRGPSGCGFKLPPHCQHLVLIAYQHTPARLIPLALEGISAGAEVVLCANTFPDNLPRALEALPLDQIRDITGWADLIAADVRLEKLESFIAEITKTIPGNLPCPVQVLVGVDMPCCGEGACAVCAIKTNHHWRLACQDGPVFDLHDLLEKRYV
jgi:hypothetical protein